jgi:ribose 1,5-bisphosphokinase
MSGGRFIAVVGPSGVGKDSVMDALCDRLPNLARAKRWITRAPEAGGEDYVPVTVADFQHHVHAGQFALWWEAHGLMYGIPASVQEDLAAGRDVIANLSRGKLEEVAALFPSFTVLSITAPAAVLAKRLASRGRESSKDIAARLARSTLTVPDTLTVITLVNDTTLEACVHQAITQLYPEHAKAHP